MNKLRLLVVALLATVLTNCQTVSSFAPEEKLIYQTGFTPPTPEQKLGAFHARFDKKGFSDLPKKYIAPITDVKMQGNCGSCWDFATVACIEGVWKAMTGISLDLSEQSVLDCSTYQNSGCQGGWDQFDYLKKNGAPSEGLYPYRAVKGQCKLKTNPDQFPNIVPEIENYGYVGPTRGTASELEVVRAIYETKGGVWISIAADADLNNPGIGTDSTFDKCSTREEENHVVQAFGFEWNEKTQKYDIYLKNSWDKTWNRNGLIKMPLGCKKLGKTVMFVTLKNPNPEPQPSPQPTPEPEPTPSPSPAPPPIPEPLPPVPVPTPDPSPIPDQDCKAPNFRMFSVSQAAVGEVVRLAVVPEEGFEYNWYEGSQKVSAGSVYDVQVKYGLTEYVVKANKACGASGEVRTRVVGF